MGFDTLARMGGETRIEASYDGRVMLARMVTIDVEQLRELGFETLAGEWCRVATRIGHA